MAATVTAAVAVLALDASTPAGLAIWLLQVVLVWVTSLWSSRAQLLWLTAVCATGAILGLWLSPNSGLALWVAAGNLFLALASMAAIAYARLRQLKAEETVHILSGLLPICSWCKKIRNEDGGWEKLETYICDRSQAEFTHGVCTECANRLYQDLAKTPPQGTRTSS